MRNCAYFWPVIVLTAVVSNLDTSSSCKLVRPNHPLITSQTRSPVKEGQDGVARCESTGGNPPPRFRWVLDNGTEIGRQWYRVHNSSSKDQPSRSDLHLPLSYREHNVKVRCLVWNKAMDEDLDLVAQSAPFQVEFSPKVTVGPAAEYFLEEGMQGHLECWAEANPPPFEFRWEKMEKKGRGQTHIWDREANITFIADISHWSRHRCIASNREGEGLAELQVNVQYGPKVSVDKVLMVEEGQDVSLRCDVDGNPPVDPRLVEWEGPSAGIKEPNGHYKLKNIKQSDAGAYTCSAKNQIRIHRQQTLQTRMGKAVMQLKVVATQTMLRWF